MAEIVIMPPIEDEDELEIISVLKSSDEELKEYKIILFDHNDNESIFPVVKVERILNHIKLYIKKIYINNTIILLAAQLINKEGKKSPKQPMKYVLMSGDSFDFNFEIKLDVR